MSTRSGPPPIVYIVVILGLGIGGWFAYNRFLKSPSSPPSTPATSSTLAPTATPPTSSTVQSVPDRPSLEAIEIALPDPTVLEMDGSVSMVKLIQDWRNLYAQQFPNLPTTYGIPDRSPNGSGTGLQNLIEGNVVLAASSRPLRADEAQAGIRVVPVAIDAIAVVVGVENPFRGSLTLEQLAQIYKGQITNWSQVGGPDRPIKVYNRFPEGGTYALFQDIVLKGDNFAPEGSNFETEQTDNTTAILRKLGSDGIGYATVSQVENQQTVEILSVEGILPTDRSAVQNKTYPIARDLYLAHPNPTSSAVQNFIEIALSQQGQQIVQDAGFIPINP